MTPRIDRPESQVAAWFAERGVTGVQRWDAIWIASPTVVYGLRNGGAKRLDITPADFAALAVAADNDAKEGA